MVMRFLIGSILLSFLASPPAWGADEATKSLCGKKVVEVRIRGAISMLGIESLELKERINAESTLTRQLIQGNGGLSQELRIKALNRIIEAYQNSDGRMRLDNDPYFQELLHKYRKEIGARISSDTPWERSKKELRDDITDLNRQISEIKNDPNERTRLENAKNNMEETLKIMALKERLLGMQGNPR